MPYLGPESPGGTRSSSATLASPFSGVTTPAGLTNLATVVTSNTHQQSIAIIQTALGGGLLTVEVLMDYNFDNFVIDQFVIGALNITERRVYRQVSHLMTLRVISVGGAQVVTGSIGGMG